MNEDGDEVRGWDEDGKFEQEEERGGGGKTEWREGKGRKA